MNRNQHNFFRERARKERPAAFTLIELLVVIAIIGALAAMVIPLSGVATTKMRTARVKAELNNLVSAIESYRMETGQYPPDHGELRQLSADDPRYKEYAAHNPLFYELTGAIFTKDRKFQTLNQHEEISPENLKQYFKREGIRNSARSRADVPYKGFRPRDSQYAELKAPQNQDIELFVVPAPGPYSIEGRTRKLNPWFYDASSTNRNNKNGFDLWAEIILGKQTNIIGNWKS